VFFDHGDALVAADLMANDYKYERAAASLFVRNVQDS
jgi:hypothetical protein